MNELLSVCIGLICIAVLMKNWDKIHMGSKSESYHFTFSHSGIDEIHRAMEKLLTQIKEK